MTATGGAGAPRSAVVVGAGIVGLSTARELLARQPDLQVTVVEKEQQVGLHQSGRNSGVIHSGVYYAPGSLRARTTRRGIELLDAFCAEHGVGQVPRGKVIVAVRPAERPRLDELLRRGRANGVPGVELIGPERLRELEPHAAGLAALHVPGVATVDFAAVTRALAADVVARGGRVACGRRVTGLEPSADGALVATTRGPLRADAVVVCAGLQADRLARLAGDRAEPAIVPFRGDYWLLRPERAGLVGGLIYPVPDPRLPFLGVHATRRHDDQVWIGPGAVLALAREGYRRGSVDPRELAELARNRALWRLGRRFWRYGASELAHSRSRSLTARALRRYLPEVVASDLLPGPNGIRAQALGGDGRLLDDFVVTRRGPITLVRNAPSPAATASMAIAELIAREMAHAG
ncbi:MAG TPA: L-2-hydroxyglutarate oxidase [Actinomycetes bacterium]|nr:L-2-hydroxyglutarate oxidase [Actinomycetes bacterium]